MRLALRAIAAAAVIAVPAALATPATAGPAICFTYSDHDIYTGPAGTVSVPLPASVQPGCTVTYVVEYLP